MIDLMVSGLKMSEKAIKDQRNCASRLLHATVAYKNNTSLSAVL